jgi:hypothetical protein
VLARRAAREPVLHWLARVLEARCAQVGATRSGAVGDPLTDVNAPAWTDVPVMSIASKLAHRLGQSAKRRGCTPGTVAPKAARCQPLAARHRETMRS